VELLDLVHCQIVSTCSNGSMDAYLLRLEGGTEEGREVRHETGCIMVSDYVPPLQREQYASVTESFHPEDVWHHHPPLCHQATHEPGAGDLSRGHSHGE